MPSLTINPTEGNFGTVITLTGTGFAINTGITIRYGVLPTVPQNPNRDGLSGTIMVTIPSTVTSDGSGDFSATIVPPNYVYDDNTISAFDGTDTAEAIFDHLRSPQYCQASDIEDWLRITINLNSDPNKIMIEDWIISNEDDMDIEMGHTFLEERQVREVFNVTRLWHWGRGLPIYPRHRNLKEFDITKGDRLEVWNGNGWQDQSSQRINFEIIKGITYIKGYLFTILVDARFRLTYRYGGNQEMQKIPKDIKRCAILMTASNVLETDFTMSQIPYGGEGNIDKDKILQRWDKKIKDIILRRSELTTIW